jgi:hypothetical protein
MIWSLGSLAKNFKVRERFNLDVRFDVQKPFKRPGFVNPSAVMNFAAPGTFGKPTVDSQQDWCCLGGAFAGSHIVKLSF